MREKDFQTKFNLWVKNRWTKGSAAFELKIAKGPSMPFSAVQDHQLRNLRSAKHARLAYKIPDVGFDQKPFDSFILMGVPAYVVVMFYSRGVKHFYMIDIDQFEAEILFSPRASLTESRAGEIGERMSL